MQITLTFDRIDEPELLKKYSELGNVSAFGPVNVLEDFPDTEILVMNSFYQIDKKILNWMKNLKVIATPTTGLDHIDIEECERRGITVLSLKGETEFLKTIPSVAELTIWFMLELLRKPHEGRFMGGQLKGKIVGVIGIGRIGKQVIKRLAPFETKGTLSFDLYTWEEHHEYVTTTFLPTCDIVSLHVPLNKETEGMLTEEHLKMMKPTALLINTARSQIIAPGAVEKAIREKWIAGYGTDVVRDDEEYQRLEALQKEGFNVVLTRHVGGYTVEARRATDEFVLKKVRLCLEEMK